MKRKALLEFANWLEKTRGPFHIMNAPTCIAAFASRHNNGKKSCYGKVSHLEEIFDLSHEQALGLYVGRGMVDADEVTRKVAARTVRYLARTGVVDFERHLP